MSRAQIRAQERRWRRGDVLAMSAAIFLGTAVAWILLSVQGLQHELQKSNEARDQLAQQVEDMGGTPVAGPAGPAGQDGAAGADGQPGQPGEDGTDGVDGTDGQDGAPPSEWTYTDQDGREYRCTPVDGFDPDNPRYRCTQTAGPEPSPQPSSAPAPEPSPTPSNSPDESSLLPLGLLDRRRN